MGWFKSPPAAPSPATSTAPAPKGLSMLGGPLGELSKKDARDPAQRRLATTPAPNPLKDASDAAAQAQLAALQRRRRAGASLLYTDPRTSGPVNLKNPNAPRTLLGS